MLEKRICKNPNCNKEFEVDKKSNAKYCCRECRRPSPETIQKRKQTCIEKYGGDNPSKAKVIKDKIKSVKKELNGYDRIWDCGYIEYEMIF